MSSTDPTNPHDSASPTSEPTGAWRRLGVVILACALAGVLTAWLLPSLLSSFEWPKIVSTQWIERLAHPPEPPRAPPPEVEAEVVQSVASPTPKQAPDGPESGENRASPQESEGTSEQERSREQKPESDESSKPKRTAPEDEPEPPRDVTYKVDRRAISKIIRTPTDLGQHGRFVPNVVDGQRRGFKFVDVAAGGLFERLGVRKGDVILEVNGRTLTTQTKLLEDLKALKSAHVYVVRIQRDDTTRIHRYDAGPPLKKAGTDANAP